jgi:hypothetical protein
MGAYDYNELRRHLPQLISLTSYTSNRLQLVAVCLLNKVSEQWPETAHNDRVALIAPS